MKKELRETEAGAENAPEDKDSKDKEEVSFETLSSREIPFETNNFIEVAKKRANTEEASRAFVSISRGFFASGDDRQKRYKRSITMPDDSEIVCKVADALKSVGSA